MGRYNMIDVNIPGLYCLDLMPLKIWNKEFEIKIAETVSQKAMPYSVKPINSGITDTMINTEFMEIR